MRARFTLTAIALLFFIGVCAQKKPNIVGDK